MDDYKEKELDTKLMDFALGLFALSKYDELTHVMKGEERMEDDKKDKIFPKQINLDATEIEIKTEEEIVKEEVIESTRIYYTLKAIIDSYESNTFMTKVLKRSTFNYDLILRLKAAAFDVLKYSNDREKEIEMYCNNKNLEEYMKKYRKETNE